MREFGAFVKKEFYHILRDKRTMLIVLVMPIVLIILFGFALSTEVRNVNIAILSPSSDPTVRQIAERLDASEYFTVTQWLDRPEEIDEVMKSGEVQLVVAFGQNFSGGMLSPDGSQMQLIVDASDANMAQSYTSYASGIIAAFGNEMASGGTESGILTQVQFLYNPQMKSAYNFVPGIMGLIMMLICAMMTSISIVREKETGTMEVLLVSPVRPIYIVVSKMVPYFVLSCINLATILLLSVFVLGVPVAGSLVARVSHLHHRQPLARSAHFDHGPAAGHRADVLRIVAYDADHAVVGNGLSNREYALAASRYLMHPAGPVVHHGRPQTDDTGPPHDLRMERDCHPRIHGRRTDRREPQETE